MCRIVRPGGEPAALHIYLLQNFCLDSRRISEVFGNKRVKPAIFSYQVVAVKLAFGIRQDSVDGVLDKKQPETVFQNVHVETVFR